MGDSQNIVAVQEAVLGVLEREGTCGLNDLVTKFRDYAWSDVFAAVVAMSRDGRVVFYRIVSTGYSDYRVALPPPTPTSGYIEARA